MNYPVWQLPFPGGILIALVAVTHVFVSHFAIGGGAFLVLSERRAYRENDLSLLAYVRRHSRFFALLTLVFGALSGVGIWFTIGLVSPEATSSLIHTFVWGWAIEWVFFFVEIIAAIVYAKSWDKLPARDHLIVGWIYLVAAWLSLVVINGIITFMLTPGNWLQTKRFADGFFNPTYFPSLLLRTAICILLAGAFGLVTVGRRNSEAREKIVRWAAQWMALGALLLPPLAAWYYHAIPGFSKAYLGGRLPVAQHVARGGIAFAALALLGALVFGVWKPRWMRTPQIVILLVLGFGVIASFEYLRELVRKPWAIVDYIYANDVRAESVDHYRESGVLNAAKFPSAKMPARRLTAKVCSSPSAPAVIRLTVNALCVRACAAGTPSSPPTWWRTSKSPEAPCRASRAMSRTAPRSGDTSPRSTRRSHPPPAGKSSRYAAAAATPLAALSGRCKTCCAAPARSRSRRCCRCWTA